MNKMKSLCLGLLFVLLPLRVDAFSVIGYEKGPGGNFWSIDLANGTRSLLGMGSGLGSFQDFDFVSEINQVPEPSIIYLLGIGVASLITQKRIASVKNSDVLEVLWNGKT